MRTDSNLDALIQSQKPRKRFNWPRFGKIFGISVLIVSVLAGATAFIVYKYVENKFNHGGNASIITTGKHPGIQLPAPVELLHAVNILVLGSDSRDVLDVKSGRPQNATAPTNFGAGHCGDFCVGGQRSDTIMLVHLTDGGRRGIVLSFPRDLRVHIPGHGITKINAAYNYGPNTVIQTITQLTGIPIDHYVEVDFNSFRQIVNTVGGLRLCVSRAYNDHYSGLYVNKPGCYHFDGNKSLAFVRMRYQDPEGDFGRIKRQQYFIRQLLEKMKSVGFLANIPAVIDLARQISKALTYDTGLTLGLVRTVVEKLGGYGAAHVDFRQVPSHPEMIGGVSYVISDEPYATELYTALRSDTALPNVGKNSLSTAIPADVTLDLENASGVKGAGVAWERKLIGMGYHVRNVITAKKLRSQTQVAYKPGSETRGQLLANAFPGSQLVSSVNMSDYIDCVLLIGKDYGSKAVPHSAIPTPYPS